MEKRGRILALDVGMRGVGSALSDELQMFAHPHQNFTNTQAGLKEILKVVYQEKIKTVVIGLPLELSGERGEQTAVVEAFVEKLKRGIAKNKNLTGVQIELWDERLSSISAERTLAGSGLKNRDRADVVDRLAAAIILESYLESARD